MICAIVSVALRAFELLLLVRAVLSWLPFDEEGGFYQFIYSVTEPVLAPVRAFLDKFEFFRNLPIDVSFIVLYLAVAAVTLILPNPFG